LSNDLLHSLPLLSRDFDASLVPCGQRILAAFGDTYWIISSSSAIEREISTPISLAGINETEKIAFPIATWNPR
jgi:hypothetical protein